MLFANETAGEEEDEAATAAVEAVAAAGGWCAGAGAGGAGGASGTAALLSPPQRRPLTPRGATGSSASPRALELQRAAAAATTSAIGPSPSRLSVTFAKDATGGGGGGGGGSGGGGGGCGGGPPLPPSRENNDGGVDDDNLSMVSHFGAVSSRLLPLGQKLQDMRELFSVLDTCIPSLKRRKGPQTITTIKESVQSSTRKDFNASVFAQIISVTPGAFLVDGDKIDINPAWPPVTAMAVQRSTAHLTLSVSGAASTLTVQEAESTRLSTRFSPRRGGGGVRVRVRM